MLNIVLIEPEIPENTGNIARTCVGFNATLHLIRPYGFILDNKKMIRSGLDYWEHLNLKEYISWQDFLKKNKINSKSNIFYFTKKSTNLLQKLEIEEDNNPHYLVFGPETRGIDEKILLKNLNKTIRIETSHNIRSLNLSNSVAIACFVWSKKTFN